MIPAIIQISNINESLNHRSKQLINGEQQIVFLIKRLQKEFGENVIIATTNRSEDDDVEIIAKILHVKIYRGKFNDVLSRLLVLPIFCMQKTLFGYMVTIRCLI